MIRSAVPEGFGGGGFAGGAADAVAPVVRGFDGVVVVAGRIMDRGSGDDPVEDGDGDGGGDGDGDGDGRMTAGGGGSSGEEEAGGAAAVIPAGGVELRVASAKRPAPSAIPPIPIASPNQRPR